MGLNGRWVATLMVRSIRLVFPVFNNCFGFPIRLEAPAASMMIPVGEFVFKA